MHTYFNISALPGNITENSFQKSFQYCHHIALCMLKWFKISLFFSRIFHTEDMKKSHKTKSGKHSGCSNTHSVYKTKGTLNFSLK